MEFSWGWLLLLANLAVTLALAGLIWTVQLVHYPLLAHVGQQAFPAYHAEHTRRITPLVGPLMVAELIASVALLLIRPDGVPFWLAAGGAVLACGVWAVTLFVSVPQHNRLSRGFDHEAWSRLVGTNWLRTAAWTAHGLLLLWMVAVAR